MNTKTLIDDLLGGSRLSEKEALSLMNTKGREILRIAEAADIMREKTAGDAVTYVRNQNIHVTNICKNLCGFCGFGRPAGSEGAYLYGPREIREKALLARKRDVTEVCLLSGVHPDFDADSYADMIRAVHEVMPEVDVHTASPEEVTYSAERSGLTSVEVLELFREAGLGTLQGTAAEILVDEVRQKICPKKVDTETWVRVIKEAHNMGIRSTATIMYGSCESVADRVRHLSIIRDIQDETGGFTEFIPLSYLYKHTRLYEAGIAGEGATGREDLLMIAISRLFLDNIPNIQISWGKVDRKLTQLLLISGGNDLGGTMFDDAVSTDAGADDADFFDPAAMQRLAEDMGRPLKQRTTLYELLD